MAQGGALMISKIGAISYLLASVAYLLLSGLLVTSWRGKSQGGLLLAASMGTAIWAGINAIQLAVHYFPSEVIWSFEILHSTLWLIFLLYLLPSTRSASGSRGRVFHLGIYGLSLTLLVILWGMSILENQNPSYFVPEIQIAGQLILALLGIVLVEQLFRNTRLDKRWYIKYLCLALGGLFIYDFYLYSDAMLFKRLNPDLWAARGFVVAFLMPFLAVSAARNPDWSVDIFVSREMVFHSTAVLGAAFYLLIMATAGYYVKIFGGEWGKVAQVAFFALALLLLLVLFFSGQARAHLRVFLNKHFFNYRYDYREEWLRFTAALSGENSEMGLEERIVKALADLVESPSGMLWAYDESGSYLCRASYGDPEIDVPLIRGDDPLVKFMEAKAWVVNFTEMENIPELYEGLTPPEWLKQAQNAWLLVPLLHENRVYGVVLLTRPRAEIDWNWEVIDILKTAGKQAASFLVLEDTAGKLIEARQFEGFNRLSAFVLHDLKNLIAQLSLVVRNADKHSNNPEFVRDAMNTVDHAVGKMSRLMSQLKNIGAENETEIIPLRPLLEEVTASRAGQLPRPQLDCTNSSDVFVQAQRDRLASAFEHIIQNAQEAAGKNGWVKISLFIQRQQAIVEIRDNGHGMDADFIRNRLFKPFETTKGLSGMGIGAYESREYIRALGGDLTVTSKPNEGASFRFTIPIAINETQSDQTTMGVSA